MQSTDTMDEKQLIQSFRQEVVEWRTKLSQLEINLVEQRAKDEVHKWRQMFGTSSSSHVEQVLDEMEARNQADVSRLANELHQSLDEFKADHLNRLDQLDAFISSINFDDDLQLDHVKYELDSIGNNIDSLQMNILVKVSDKSERRHSATALTRNAVELIKVFEFDNPPPPVASSYSIMDPIRDFVRRVSETGASYYNTGVLDQPRRS
jgi:hypothetical protein